MRNQHIDFGFKLALLNTEISAQDLFLELQLLDLIIKAVELIFDSVHLEVTKESLPAIHAEGLLVDRLTRHLLLKESD